MSLVEQFEWVDTFRNSLVSGNGEFPSKVYIKLLLSISLHSTELLNYYINNNLKTKNDYSQNTINCILEENNICFKVMLFN